MAQPLPSKSDFLAYFRSHKIHPKLRELFVAHYRMPGRAATAGELATAVKYRAHMAVNLNYGIHAKEAIEYWVHNGLWTYADLLDGLISAGVQNAGVDEVNPSLSVFMKRFSRLPGKNNWVLYMSDQLAEALEDMGWISGKARVVKQVDMEDENDPASYEEGGVKYRRVRQYERSVEARKKCIAVNGTSCAVCGLSFGDRFGEDFSDLIVVHHVHPMARGKNRKTDPKTDLQPLCPNCHAMVHYGRPGNKPRSIEELRTIIG